MDWNAIGAVADVVGALGVVASLVYLAIQIRLNTLASKTAAGQAVEQSIANINLTTAANEILNATIEKGLLRPNELNAAEGSGSTSTCFRTSSSFNRHTRCTKPACLMK